MVKFVFHPKIGVIYLDQFHGKSFVVLEIVFLELSLKICRGAQSNFFELWLDKVLGMERWLSGWKRLPAKELQEVTSVEGSNPSLSVFFKFGRVYISSEKS